MKMSLVYKKIAFRSERCIWNSRKRQLGHGLLSEWQIEIFASVYSFRNDYTVDSRNMNTFAHLVTTYS